MKAEAMILKSLQKTKAFNLIRTTAGYFEIVCTAAQLQRPQGHSRNSLTDTVLAYTTLSSTIPTGGRRK